jgi:hypothetical protein
MVVSCFFDFPLGLVARGYPKSKRIALIDIRSSFFRAAMSFSLKTPRHIRPIHRHFRDLLPSKKTRRALSISGRSD